MNTYLSQNSEEAKRELNHCLSQIINDENRINKSGSISYEQHVGRWIFVAFLACTGIVPLVQLDILSESLVRMAGYVNIHFVGFDKMKSIFQVVIVGICIVQLCYSIIIGVINWRNKEIEEYANRAKGIRKRLNEKILAIDEDAKELETILSSNAPVDLLKRKAPKDNDLLLDALSIHNGISKIDTQRHESMRVFFKASVKVYICIFLPLVACFFVIVLPILYNSPKTIDHYRSVAYCRENDVILLGAYEQDRDLGNGKEAIQWRVVKRDGDIALVVSDYILDVHPFHNVYKNVTWQDSTIRRWLNEQFFNTAFTSQEAQMIIPTLIENTDYIKCELFEKDGEWRYWKYDKQYKPMHRNATTDSVFLLSFDEAQMLKSIIPKISEYAKYGGSAADPFYQRSRDWLLRSTIRNDDVPSWHPEESSKKGYRLVYAVVQGYFWGWYLNYNDTYKSVNNDTSGIRPAIYLRIPKTSVDSAS